MHPPLHELLEQYTAQFHPVVPFDNEKDTLLPMDFTAANTELTGPIVADTALFSAWVNRKISEAGARYGIGGYAEHRTVYSISAVFDGAAPGEEPRRLHLGIDIWGPAGTPVMAPLKGRIHSFAFNNRFGDYGATIILEHTLRGNTFLTLYGHLSLDSLEGLKEGNPVQKGQPFTAFGIPAENGYWPPHLHFQVIRDIGSGRGDYPGVCRFSEKEKYLANCPDPGLMIPFLKGK